MQEYIKVEALEDDTIQLNHKSPDDYELVLKKDIVIPAKDMFKYYSNLTIKIIQDHIEVIFIPDTEEETTYICLMDEIKRNTEKISFELHNITKEELIIKAGTVLGNFMVMIQATHTEKPDISYYYKTDFLEVREVQKGVINRFTYIIDEKGFHKLQFLLNQHLIEGKPGSEFQLG